MLNDFKNLINIQDHLHCATKVYYVIVIRLNEHVWYSDDVRQDYLFPDWQLSSNASLAYFYPEH